jgi:hypothetical protein
MYCSILTDERVKMIDFLCVKHDINESLRQKLVKISHTIIQQNYFQLQNTLFIQDKGVAMGAPTPSIFYEIYLQLIENTAIYDILVKQQIIGYFRYVDDVLIEYNKTTTNTDDLLNTFNNLMPTMKCTMKNGVDN